jgi:neutral amino acid transport system permease protein
VDFVAIFQSGMRAAVGPVAAVYALAAIGLNMHYGYTGLRNFGHVGFLLVGAYGLGISVATFGWSMWVGVLVGIAAAVVFALLLGLPTLRLRTDYFAIATIASAEILRLVARSTSATDLTGGPFGLQGVSPRFYELNPISPGRYGFGRFTFSAGQLWSMLVIWTLVALATLLLMRLMRSPWGRVIRSIREDEDVARSLGKNVYSYKIQSLVLGGVLAGLAGVMLAMFQNTVNANTFDPRVTFFLYAALILGGAATRIGPIVGAMLFWFILASGQNALRQAGDEGLLPGVLGDSTSQGALAYAVVGIGLVALMVFRPQGIFGSKQEMELGD